MLGRSTFPPDYATANGDEARPDTFESRAEEAGCYASRAVLGGELAVPCTCNPLQQG